MYGGHYRNAEVDLAAAYAHSETPVLGDAPFRDVQLRHYLDSLYYRLVVRDIDWVGSAIKRPVYPVFDRDIRVASLNVDVGRSPFQCVKNHGIDQFYDRRDLFVARKPVQVQVLFAVLCLPDQGEPVGAKLRSGILQYPGCGIAAFQRLFNSRPGSHRNLDPLP